MAVFLLRQIPMKKIYYLALFVTNILLAQNAEQANEKVDEGIIE